MWGPCCFVDCRCGLHSFLFKKAQAVLDHLIWGVDRGSWVKVWAIAEQGFIGGHPQSGVGVVVVNSGSDREPFIPVILLSHCEETEVLLYPLVLSFGEPICLGMERGGQILCYPKLCSEGFAEVRCEMGVTV